MKKIEYKAPELELIILKNQMALLAGSIDEGDEPEQGSGGGGVPMD